MDEAKRQPEQRGLTLHATAELADLLPDSPVLLLKPAVLLPDFGELLQSSLPASGFNLPGLSQCRVPLLAGLLSLKALPQALHRETRSARLTTRQEQNEFKG